MKLIPKIDKLTFSTPLKRKAITYPYKDIPGFKHRHILSEIKLKEVIKEAKDPYIFKYKNVRLFKQLETNNSLIICNIKKERFKRASPIYLIFIPHYPNKITYKEVIPVEQFFKHLGIKLRISIIHLALDFVSRTNSDLYNLITLAIKPGTKRKPSLIYYTTVYFGEPKSNNQLIVYDKTQQLSKVKGVKIPDNVCRVELRMNIPKMKNLIKTTEELAHYDWSFVYKKFYSFRHRHKDLKKDLKDINEDWRQPIWELRDIAFNKLHVYPSNFYRDYLIDHPQLTPSVKRALADYRWIND